MTHILWFIAGTLCYAVGHFVGFRKGHQIGFTEGVHALRRCVKITFGDETGGPPPSGVGLLDKGEPDQAPPGEWKNSYTDDLKPSLRVVK